MREGRIGEGERKRERDTRIRRQSGAQMPPGFRSDVSNGSRISMANGTCQILATCLAKGFVKSAEISVWILTPLIEDIGRVERGIKLPH